MTFQRLIMRASKSKNVVGVVMLLGLFFPASVSASSLFLSPMLDGFVQRYVEPTETWSEIRAGAGNSALVETKADCQALAQEFGWRAMGRCVFKFDTSGIADDAVIVSAQLHLYVEAHNNEFGALGGNEYLNIVFAPTGSDSELVPDDYAYTNFGTTVLGSLDFYETIDGVYNTIEIDPSAISKTGITTFGGRVQVDT